MKKFLIVSIGLAIVGSVYLGLTDPDNFYHEKGRTADKFFSDKRQAFIQMEVDQLKSSIIAEQEEAFERLAVSLNVNKDLFKFCWRQDRFVECIRNNSLKPVRR